MASLVVDCEWGRQTEEFHQQRAVPYIRPVVQEQEQTVLPCVAQLIDIGSVTEQQVHQLLVAHAACLL